eukprot:TRINITY_DN7998_c0_g1_i1.p1 TRINITY_DN7998_c0_g1~~TRINITY_DN7998_c0_g1_i1.p1  ORF type:complete len:288 (-),score=18.85 TRINITY_DN7998_c0_g1_i1:21-848(-)
MSGVGDEKGVVETKWSVAVLSPYVAFFLMMYLFFVDYFSHWGLILGTVVVYTIISMIAKRMIPRIFPQFSKDETDELINKSVSLLFNIPSGIAAYLLHYNVIVPTMPPYESILDPVHHPVIDFFASLCIGYVIFDLWISKSYPRNNPNMIKWHHIAELILCYGYVVSPGVGSVYMASGGMMQISSGIFHIKRVYELLYKYDKKAAYRRYFYFWHYVLMLAWFHARIWVYSFEMYFCVVTYPFDVIHKLILFAGGSLTIMNTLWLIKMVSGSSSAI